MFEIFNTISLKEMRDFLAKKTAIAIEKCLILC